MSSRAIRIGLAGMGLLVAVAVLVFFYRSRQTEGVVVTLRHESKIPATELEVSVRGDRERLSRLGPGEKRELVLQPDGESSVQLRYRLGDQACRWSGEYVEATGYRVVLAIRGCGDVEARTSLRY